MIITSYSLPRLPFYCERKGLKWIGQSVIATLSHWYHQVYRWPHVNYVIRLNTLLHFVLYICNKQIRLKQKTRLVIPSPIVTEDLVFIMKAKRFVIISMVLKGVQDPTVLLHISVLNAKRQVIHKTNVENPFHHSPWHLNEGSHPPPEVNRHRKQTSVPKNDYPIFLLMLLRQSMLIC